MKRRTLLAAALLPLFAQAAEPYRDFLPNLPTELPRPLESEQDFLSQCRDEEAYVFTKHTGRYYANALYKAAHGEKEALAALFSVAPFQDGAGAEGFADTLFWLLNHVFAKALAEKSPKVRIRVIGLLDFAASYDYSAKHPRTFKLAKHLPVEQ